MNLDELKMFLPKQAAIMGIKDIHTKNFKVLFAEVYERLGQFLRLCTQEKIPFSDYLLQFVRGTECGYRYTPAHILEHVLKQRACYTNCQDLMEDYPGLKDKIELPACSKCGLPKLPCYCGNFHFCHYCKTEEIFLVALIAKLGLNVDLNTAETIENFKHYLFYQYVANMLEILDGWNFLPPRGGIRSLMEDKMKLTCCTWGRPDLSKLTRARCGGHDCNGGKGCLIITCKPCNQSRGSRCGRIIGGVTTIAVDTQSATPIENRATQIAIPIVSQQSPPQQSQQKSEEALLEAMLGDDMITGNENENPELYQSGEFDVDPTLFREPTEEEGEEKKTSKNEEQKAIVFDEMPFWMQAFSVSTHDFKRKYPILSNAIFIGLICSMSYFIIRIPSIMAVIDFPAWFGYAIMVLFGILNVGFALAVFSHSMAVFFQTGLLIMWKIMPWSLWDAFCAWRLKNAYLAKEAKLKEEMVYLRKGKEKLEKRKTFFKMAMVQPLASKRRIKLSEANKKLNAVIACNAATNEVVSLFELLLKWSSSKTYQIFGDMLVQAHERFKSMNLETQTGKLQVLAERLNTAISCAEMEKTFSDWKETIKDNVNEFSDNTELVERSRKCYKDWEAEGIDEKRLAERFATMRKLIAETRSISADIQKHAREKEREKLNDGKKAEREKFKETKKRLKQEHALRWKEKKMNRAGYLFCTLYALFVLFAVIKLEEKKEAESEKMKLSIQKDAEKLFLTAVENRDAELTRANEIIDGKFSNDQVYKNLKEVVKWQLKKLEESGQKIDALEKESDSLNEKLKEEKVSKDRLAALLKDQKKLEEQISKLQKKYSGLENSHKELQGKLGDQNTLKSKLKTSEEEKKKFKEQNEALTKTVEDIRQRLGDQKKLNDEMVSLKSKNATLDGKFNTLTGEHNLLLDKLKNQEALLKRISELEAEIRSQKVQIAELEKALKEAQNATTLASLKVPALEASSEEAKSRIKAYETQRKLIALKYKKELEEKLKKLQPQDADGKKKLESKIQLLQKIIE